jgi:Outer membrane protein beta-barrel domain
MQRNFYTDDFEQLIRQKADQYKMYPSDHVWKGVHRALHGGRRWYWTGLVVMLLGAGLFTANYLLNQQTVNPLASSLQSSLTAAQEADNDAPLSTPQRAATDYAFSKPIPERVSEESDKNLIANSIESSFLILTAPVEKNFTIITDPSSNSRRLVGFSTLEIESAALTTSHVATPEFADAASESALQTEQPLNWLQEHAVYQLTASKAKRIGWALYFSPTMNYRKLTGGSSLYSPASEIQSVPLALSFNGAVDQFVNHKPALGFELGSSFLYRTSKNVNFKAGIQFNYSRYNIEAYSSHPEKATIALSPYWDADTIVSYTSVRNLGGYAQQEIANQYFELSMPVGVEVRLFGNEKLQLNVAGSLQPTYLLNRNSYLITTDYKNYTREPSLVRRWNVNAGLETYVAYNKGTVRWQLGPQFRYQLLSSYANKYPIKEYLMEYGFKIGVSKTIR